MHLVFLNPVGVVGGAERVLLSAASAVRRLRPDWRVTAILLGPGPLEGQLANLGVEVLVLPLPAALSRLGDSQVVAGRTPGGLARLGWSTLRSSATGWAFLRRLRQVFVSLHPQLIHTNGMKAHLLACFTAPRGTQIVWHLHDLLSQRLVMAKVLRRASRSAEAALAISEAVKSDAHTVLPRRLPIAVVRNGIDTDHFTSELAQPADLDQLASLAPACDNVVRVGLVATYANWKGHDVFLEAVARLPPDAPPIRAYIIGGPIYATPGSQFTEAQLQARASQLGIAAHVGFIPFQGDTAAVYRALDIVVHASTRPEPFGLTIVEAMACGRAVIVSSAGGAAELFTPDFDAVGHCPGDVSGLAGAIRRLAADPELRRSLGANARATAKREFSLERFSGQLIAFYDSL